MPKKAIIKEQSKASGIFWRIFITLIGVCLILIAINNVLLGIFGETAVAAVSTRRVGGSNDNEPPERQYEWSIDYTFTVAGKEYNGHASHRGSAISVKYDNEVHYYTFAPQINSIDANAMPGIESFVYIGLGVLLILVMNKPKKKKRKSSKPIGKSKKIIYQDNTDTNNERVTMAWLMENTTEYDDSVEEYYQNGWDKGDPSWQCECGKWNEKDFCTKCGKHKI